MLLRHAQLVNIYRAHLANRAAARAWYVPMGSTKSPRALKHAQTVRANMGSGACHRLAALLFRPACARMERLAVVFSSSWIPLLQNVYANQNVMRENMVQQMIVFNARS